MLSIHPQFITDAAGQKLVVLPVNEFNSIMDELDEAEDIRLYDEAKKDDDGPSIPIDEAFKIIEAKRSGKK
jgi:PHD/YefM family antitoxin component YafN of YafNO toxin-antitoxin module